MSSNSLSRDNENLLLVAAFYTRASGKDPILMNIINLL